MMGKLSLSYKKSNVDQDRGKEILRVQINKSTTISW